jgi:mono/diheme cytochrome c family protein
LKWIGVGIIHNQSYETLNAVFGRVKDFIRYGIQNGKQGVAMHEFFPHQLIHRISIAMLALLGAALAAAAHGATPDDLVKGYSIQAGVPAQPLKGQQLFTERHGREWSCSSCHGALPTQPGKHAGTAKAIGTLAPAFNPERFTDIAKTEKWFRRNCNDVLGRECSAAEKANVLSWLLTLKP